ncbi:MAG: HAD family hydrolase [Rickettsiales bacterium]|nr:HAD family hydrolase [Rickettsiales bacterium]
MLAQLQAWKIKAIIWDVDGTLANLNHAYYCFIKNHQQFREHFCGLRYKNLDKALPIDPAYGAMELKTHPTLGAELDKVFCASDDYYFDRPLYYGTEHVLKKLDKMGYQQFILSAGFNTDKKMQLLNQLFGAMPFIKIEVVEHDKNGMEQGNTKEARIVSLCEKYNLKPSEVVLVDDRIYNIHSALKAGIHAIRFRSEFTTPNPHDLKNIPEAFDIREFLY